MMKFLNQESGRARLVKVADVIALRKRGMRSETLSAPEFIFLPQYYLSTHSMS